MIIIIIVGIIVGFTICIMIIRAIYKYFAMNKLSQLFGYPINNDSYAELNKEYYNKLEEKSITQTTADDFELDKVFNVMNRTYSDVGREYMYAQLFSKNHKNDLLEYIIEQFKDQKKFKNALYELYYLSKTYGDSLELFDNLDFLSTFDFIMVIISSICPFFLVGAAFMVGENVLPFFVLWASLQTGLYTYYSKKTNHAMSKASSYCYLVSVLNHLNKLHIYPKDESQKIHKMSQKALRYTFVNKICDSVEVIDVFYLMEFIKGMFSLPIYQCYILLKHKDELKEDFLKMYEYVGIVDMAIAMMSIRQSYVTCIPESTDKFEIRLTECYHPLIENPVKNSFSTDQSCIITGSNASGKSTFLKTVGLNLILAEAYHTCFADELSYYPYHVCSSIHMKDDLESGDSYYVKEIKTLKNIIDQVNNQKCVVFIDEILRGTNEKERVLIAKVLLKYLFDSDSLIFVTTHDLSIVRSFEDIDKYCFNDYVDQQELRSDYKLHPGICQIGNAIALLGVYGFDKKILKELENSQEQIK